MAVEEPKSSKVVTTPELKPTKAPKESKDSFFLERKAGKLFVVFLSFFLKEFLPKVVFFFLLVIRFEEYFLEGGSMSFQLCASEMIKKDKELEMVSMVFTLPKSNKTFAPEELPLTRNLKRRKGGQGQSLPIPPMAFRVNSLFINHRSHVLVRYIYHPI